MEPNGNKMGVVFDSMIGFGTGFVGAFYRSKLYIGWNKFASDLHECKYLLIIT
jgi:hypothetical protein